MPNPSTPTRRLDLAMLLPAILASALFLAVGPLSAETLEGTLTLIEDGEAKTDKEVRYALAWFAPDAGTPDAGTPAAGTPAEPFEIAMVRKEFQPRVLPIPVGAAVAFPNGDAILHNVFSLDRANRFDLGLYRRGESKTVTFDAAGIVEVFCNVHHSMVAHVVVLETPYFTRVDSDGRFELEGLPAGPGRLTVWHERADPQSFDVTVEASAKALDLRLEITKPRVPPHRNKFGKPYSRKRRGKAY